MSPTDATIPTLLILLAYAATSAGHHHLLTLDEVCRATLHRSICIHSLSSPSRPHSARHSRRWWTNTALSLAADDVSRVASHLAPLSRRTAIPLADCAECLADAEQQLHGSLDELQRLEPKTFELQMGDVLTWVSAALTDEDTCLDGLAEVDGGGGRVAAKVRRLVSNTTYYTSNALALKYFIWLPEHTDRVRKNFGARCSCRLRDMFTDLRKSGQKPAWIGDDVWLQLLAEWAKPEYVQMREKNKQNRASDAEGSSTSLHTRGSIPHIEHRRRLRESLGREPTMAELHQRTHQCQSNKEWVDQRSSTVHSEYMRLREHSQASEGQASQIADFDAWREAAGGKKKGRIYGLGSVGHGEGTSSQSAHSVDSSGSTIERMIQRAMDPFARQFEEHTRELTQLREEVARLRQRPNIPEEDDEESTD